MKLTIAVGLAALAGGCTTATAPHDPAQYVADLLYEGKPAGVPEIMTLSLRTGCPARVFAPYTVAGHPTASPDGARLAFVVTDSFSTTDIYTAHRDGSQVTRLTFDQEDSDQPAWSPDGTRIAFHSTREGRLGDIWVMDADGSNPVNLTPELLPGVTDEWWPAWSPDGSRIAYASNAGGTGDIWVMNTDGSGTQRLTTGGEIETEPTWSPDGSTIAFRRAGKGKTDIVLIAASGGAATPLGLGGDERWQPAIVYRAARWSRSPATNDRLRLERRRAPRMDSRSMTAGG